MLDDDYDRPTLDAAESGLNPSQIALLCSIMERLELSPDERITEEQLFQTLRSIGLNPTEDDVGEAAVSVGFKKLPKDFTFGEVTHIWHQLLTNMRYANQMLKLAFSFFDRDGSGKIDQQEFYNAMVELGEPLTMEEVRLFISLIDKNNDGKVDFGEFNKTLELEARLLAMEERALAHKHGDGPPRSLSQEWEKELQLHF